MKKHNSLSLLIVMVAIVQFGMCEVVFAKANVTEASIIDGYSSCSWVKRVGNEGAYANVTIKFKSTVAPFDEKYGLFLSRAIVVYTYDKNGSMVPMPLNSGGAYLDDKRHGAESSTDEYAVFSSLYQRPWSDPYAFSTNVKVALTAHAVKQWQAVSIRAGNLYLNGMYLENSKSAYIGAYQEDGTCAMIDPTLPPPPAISINMTAPDWDLGELPVGESEKIFTARKDQLCLTYTASMVESKKFIIYATNSNGIANNKFQLKNADDSAQIVPYSVKMVGGVGSFNLPNSNFSAVELDSSGATCFVPVFNASVKSSMKEGDYSDVLTFTVITKS